MILETITFQIRTGMSREDVLADADYGHDPEWFDRAEAHWGNRPERKLCDVLMVLDNRHDDVREFASELA